MGRTFLFLGGDGWPLDRAVEEALRARLPGPGDRFIGHEAVLGGETTTDSARRSRRLFETLLPLALRSEPVILIGRSSGSRIATAIAPLVGARGGSLHVVALAYPFENPERGPEPERYRHLATLCVTTLIVQGTRDDYGGRDILTRYAFAPAVEVMFVDGTHDFRLDEAQWDMVVERIGRFIGGGGQGVRASA
jgi:pimeloyl-ACP methyl ester carboxylesterase